MEANLTDKVKLLPWLQSIITERKMSDSFFSNSLTYLTAATVAGLMMTRLFWNL